MTTHNKLDPRLQRIITARHAGITYREIATIEGVTTERIRQLHQKANRIMRILERMPDPLTPETLITNTLASTRLKNACSGRIFTLAELAAYGKAEFELIRNCRHKTSAEAEALLAEAGLRFK